MSELHWIQSLPSRQRLLGVRKLLEDDISLDDLPTKLNLAKGDYREFEHEIGGKSWRGIIFQKRNSIMGSVFSYFDGEPLLIRGYGKIHYAEDSSFLYKECYAEEKLDGTNLLFWTFPDGTLMCKTRLVERGDLQGYQGNVWMEMAEKTGLLERVKSLCEEGYLVVGELFGEDNPGEFIRYTMPLALKFFEVCDLATLEWVNLETKTDLLQKFGLPQVEVSWRGELNSENIFKLEKLAETLVKEDGIEGFIVKHYDESLRDTCFGKVKCAAIKEIAWRLVAVERGVPAQFIRKAGKKAWDNQAMFGDMDEIIGFVRQELLEEFAEERVDKSRSKIKKIIHSVFSPPEEREKMWRFFEELEVRGIDITNKGKVLSMAAKRFVGIKPSIPYKCWESYLLRKRKT